jgi:hypothetical protein
MEEGAPPFLFLICSLQESIWGMKYPNRYSSLRLFILSGKRQNSKSFSILEFQVDRPLSIIFLSFTSLHETRLSHIDPVNVAQFYSQINDELLPETGI